jgi:hypothetical protein
MNAGLTNLTTLKNHLLPKTMATDDRFDQVITDIGLGVAGLFDTFLNRDLVYKEDDEVICSGDRPHFCLSRYPVVAIKSIAMRYFDSNPWQDITGQPMRTDARAGMVHFGGVLGTEALQVRIVWTGGYWYDQLDPDDEGYPGAAPTGAAVLPNELRSAFLLQCRAVWQAIDKLGADLTSTGSSSQFVTGSLSGLDLSPAVKQVLNEYIRYQLT